MQFVVPGKPQGKARAKVVVRGKWAHAYTPEQTASYENFIKLCFIEAAKKDTETLYCKELSMRISAHYAVPKSFSRIKATAALRGDLRPQTKPDADNVCKVVCDALNKVAYNDDSQIVELYFEKRYSNEPRLVVAIEEFKQNNGTKKND